MIKVIASDMDGTLLDDNHQLAEETLEAIHRACDAGIRFIVATGRNFQGAMQELKGAEMTCDYIVGSGAEVRGPDSMNDYSMLSMDFGATVAMENAMPEVKSVAKYMTRANSEFGVAHAIYRLLEHYGK